jgi:hypothetical protein
MKDLVNAVAEADSWFSLGAIFLIGIYVLMWRFGGKLLDAVQENTRLTKANGNVAHEANQTVSAVREAIITNHGSKNLGDAIDRITDKLVAMGEDAAADRRHLTELHQAFIAKSMDGDNLEERISKKFGELDDRLSEIEQRVNQPAK